MGKPKAKKRVRPTAAQQRERERDRLLDMFVPAVAERIAGKLSDIQRVEREIAERNFMAAEPAPTLIARCKTQAHKLAGMSDPETLHRVLEIRTELQRLEFRRLQDNQTEARLVAEIEHLEAGKRLTPEGGAIAKGGW